MRRLELLIIGIAVLTANAAGAQGMGRLFSTPEERAALDEARHDPDFGKVAEAAPVQRLEVSTPEGPVVPHVTINGVVFRSSGLNASWINGISIPASDSTREGIRVETRRFAGGGTVKLGFPGGLETVQIKPGQKIDLVSGGVFEPYEYKASEGAELFEDFSDPADSEETPPLED